MQSRPIEPGPGLLPVAASRIRQNSEGRLRPPFSLPSQTDLDLGLYLHTPYCVHKCPYCDFNSGPLAHGVLLAHLSALEKEIRCSPWKKASAQTLYLGGGTPSELETEALEQLIGALEDTFNFRKSAERTIECNPGTVSRDKLKCFGSLGFNRVSIGAQSFQDKELRTLGRIHDASETEASLKWAREAGFDNTNLDLIYGFPGHTLDNWKSSLERALELEPEHLSLYGLIVEDDTQFGRLEKAGRLDLPKEDLLADMYELALEGTAQAGYLQYEISNFAKAGYECTHNWLYWQNEPFIGFGLSAASYLEGRRWKNAGDLNRFETLVEEGQLPVQEWENLPPPIALAEALMLGLRTNQGVCLTQLSQDHGLDCRKHFEKALNFLSKEGLLREIEGRLTLTRRGQLLANEVLVHFFPD